MASSESEQQKLGYVNPLFNSLYDWESDICTTIEQNRNTAMQAKGNSLDNIILFELFFILTFMQG